MGAFFRVIFETTIVIEKLFDNTDEEKRGRKKDTRLIKQREREREIKKTISVTGFINDAIYPFRNNGGLLICW